MDPSFQAFAEKYATYGYPVLFFGVLLESAGIPVPAETAVLVAGFLASPAGGSHFSLPIVIVITALAAMLGDNVGYELGRRFARPRLAAGKRFLFLTPALLHRAEGYFERYGTWTIFLGRFVAALRVAAALAAGTAGMPWRRFFIANAAGAVLWATAITLLGYFFGQSWELLEKYLGRSGLILGCFVALLFGLPYLVRRARAMRLSNAVPGRMVIVQAIAVVLLELVCVALLVLLAHGHHTTRIDREVREWIVMHPWSVMGELAPLGVALGTLPAACLAAACLAAWLAYRRRPGRELLLLAGMLIGSEALGWVLIGLLHRHREAIVAADIWPYGFAGLGPLRAVAVYGAGTYLWHRQKERGLVWVAGLLLILWVCVSVIWTLEQSVTQVLLEGAAGALLLFGGVRWLQRDESTAAAAR